MPTYAGEDANQAKKKDPQLGDGVLSTLMSPVYALSNRAWALAAGPSRKETSRFREFLNKNKDKKIVSIDQARMPVNGIVQSAVNGLSLGGFKKKLKEQGQPTAYHDFLIVTLDDGHRYRIEKNHVAESMAAKNTDFDYITRRVDLRGKNITLPGLYDTASRGDKDFHKYRGGSRNCQDHVRSVLERNGLDAAPDLPKQDADALVKTVVGGERVPNFITDLAGHADRVIHGDGIRLRVKK